MNLIIIKNEPPARKTRESTRRHITARTTPRARVMPNVATTALLSPSPRELRLLRQIELLKRARAVDAELRKLEDEDEGGGQDIIISCPPHDNNTVGPTHGGDEHEEAARDEHEEEARDVVPPEHEARDVDEPVRGGVGVVVDEAEPFKLRILGIECDATKVCRNAVSQIFSKMEATPNAKQLGGMAFHPSYIRTVALNNLVDGCTDIDSEIDAFWSQSTGRLDVPCKKDTVDDRWWFDYESCRAWLDEPAGEHERLTTAANVLESLKQSPPPRDDPKLLPMCVGSNKEGKRCTKHVNATRLNKGKVTCGYHDGQDPMTLIAGRLQQEGNNKRQSIADADADADELLPRAVSKRTRWTDEEHRLFVEGMTRYGSGMSAYRKISESFVQSKTPAQVASHAQKYLLKRAAGGVATSRMNDDSAMQRSDAAPNRSVCIATDPSSVSLYLDHIVWVKTGKTTHWPGTVREIHDGHGLCTTREGQRQSVYTDGKKRYVIFMYDGKVSLPVRASSLTYFCPGTHFERYKRLSKSEGFVNAVKLACEDYNASRIEHDKQNNVPTAQNSLCTL